MLKVLPFTRLPALRGVGRESDGGGIRSRKFYKTYLSYNGAPKKPKEHDQLMLKVFEFPLNEWHLAPGTHVV